MATWRVATPPSQLHSAPWWLTDQSSPECVPCSSRWILIKAALCHISPMPAPLLHFLSEWHHLHSGAKPGHREPPELHLPHPVHPVISPVISDSAFLSGCTLRGTNPGTDVARVPDWPCGDLWPCLGDIAILPLGEPWVINPLERKPCAF